MRVRAPPICMKRPGPARAWGEVSLRLGVKLRTNPHRMCTAHRDRDNQLSRQGEGVDGPPRPPMSRGGEGDMILLRN